MLAGEGEGKKNPTGCKRLKSKKFTSKFRKKLTSLGAKPKAGVLLQGHSGSGAGEREGAHRGDEDDQARAKHAARQTLMSLTNGTDGLTDVYEKR